MTDHLHAGGEKFELTFEAQASDIPPIARVRQLLKAALRSWRLRCTSARDVTAYPDPPAELQAGQLPNDLAEGDTPDRQTAEGL